MNDYLNPKFNDLFKLPEKQLSNQALPQAAKTEKIPSRRDFIQKAGLGG